MHNRAKPVQNTTTSYTVVSPYDMRLLGGTPLSKRL